MNFFISWKPEIQNFIHLFSLVSWQSKGRWKKVKVKWEKREIQLTISRQEFLCWRADSGVTSKRLYVIQDRSFCVWSISMEGGVSLSIRYSHFAGKNAFWRLFHKFEKRVSRRKQVLAPSQAVKPVSTPLQTTSHNSLVSFSVLPF